MNSRHALQLSMAMLIGSSEAPFRYVAPNMLGLTTDKDVDVMSVVAR